MLTQAANSVTTSTHVGEWLAGFLVIGAGAVLVYRGQRAKKRTQGVHGERKFGIGIGLLVLGAVMTVVQATGITDRKDTASDKSLDRLVILAQRNALQQPFRITSTLPGRTVDESFVGDDVVGKQTIGKAVVEIVKVEGDFFLRGNQQYWAGMVGDRAEALTTYLGKRWMLLGPNDPDFKTTIASADRDAFVKGAIPSGGTWVEGETKAIHGVECVEIKGSKSGAIYVDRKSSRVMRFVDSNGNVADLTYANVERPTRPKSVISASDLD